MHGSKKIPTIVQSRVLAAERILLLRLRSADGQDLPGYTAGSHIDLRLPDSLTRSYSLIDPPGGAINEYAIAVACDQASRGGSKYVHESLGLDNLVEVSMPVNTFSLAEHAAHSVFVAGGIGITPIRSMLYQLTALGSSWELHYAARTRRGAIFVAELTTLAKGLRNRVITYFGDESEYNGTLNIPAVVASAPAHAHLYCCGPPRMREVFLEATSERSPENVHVESFGSATTRSHIPGFDVRLVRSGVSIWVDRGKTILDALLDSGINVPFSCMEGVCGTCKVSVLSGQPDHRDTLLTQSEREAGDIMLICCSGARTPVLVLDV